MEMLVAKKIGKVFFGVVIIFLLLPHFAKGSTVVDSKIFRNESGTGECLISSGFPLTKGLVTEDLVREGKIKIIVNGSEVAANVSALRGRHSDGTLRSMLVQFGYSLAEGEEISAQVIIDGGIRTLSDPEYIRPTLAMVTNNNVILPSDNNYLVTTNLTLRNLIPVGTGTVNEERFYTEMAENRFDALSISQAGGTASYEHVSAILSLWLRSGNKKYQKEAINQTVNYWLNYNTPLSNQTPPCKADAITNPDGRTGGQTCGVAAEWNEPRFFSYAQMYLMTGYRDFWGIVAYEAQRQQWNVTSQAEAFNRIAYWHEYDTPRFNYATRYGAMLAAMQIDATIAVDGQYSTGRNYDWEDQIDWTIDALESYKWNFKWIPFDSGSGAVPVRGITITQNGVSATLLGVYPSMHDEQAFSGNAMPATGYFMVNNITGGSFAAGALTGISASATGVEISDYREGIVAGSLQNSPRGLTSVGDTSCIPIFQLIFPTYFMVDTYLYFYQDPRIPAIVKRNLDVILQNIRPTVEGDVYYGWNGGIWGNHTYVKPYPLENPINVAATSTCGGGNQA
ncbi:MAG: hypothetical protein ACD_9C00030G0004, partial [uncultured bacterium]